MGGEQMTTTLQPGWQEIIFPVAQAHTDTLTLTIESTTFHPRDFDRASPDARALGVLVDWVEVTR
jgi:hypothetical protein